MIDANGFCRQALKMFVACILIAGCAPTGKMPVQLIGLGLIHPRSIAVSPQGYVYVADDDGRLFPEKGRLIGVSPAGTTRKIELGDLIPWSIATDARDNIYATMMPLLDKGIYRIDPDTGPKRLWTATYPKAIAASADGDVYVIDAVGIDNSQIVRIARNGETTVVASHLQGATALAVDRSGNLYVSDYASVSMIRTDGQTTPIARRLCTATALANDGAGEPYVIDQGRWQILKVTRDGAVFKIGSGFENPVGIAFDADNHAYVIESGNSAVKKFSVSAARHTQTDLASSCFASPRSLPDN